MKRFVWIACFCLCTLPGLAEEHDQPGMEAMSPEEQAILRARLAGPIV